MKLSLRKLRAISRKQAELIMFLEGMRLAARSERLEENLRKSIELAQRVQRDLTAIIVKEQEREP